MGKLNKLLGHIKNGTLTSRIKYQYSGLRRWEKLKASGKEFLIEKITKKSKLKLYKDSYLSYLILKGDFEMNERRFLQRYLKPGDNFVDIGANIGYFSILASEYITDRGKVYAFEPSAQTYQRLLENIKLNNRENIVGMPYALADSKKESVLHVSTDGFDAWNSLGAKPSEGGFSDQLVECVTLDWFFSENAIEKVKMIKIDVEGFEWLVLKGAFNVLDRMNCLWMIEFNDENFARNGYSGKQLVDYLVDQHDMKLFSIGKDGTLFNLRIPERFDYCNIVAVKTLESIEPVS